jgi:hypothetical protein
VLSGDVIDSESSNLVSVSPLQEVSPSSVLSPSVADSVVRINQQLDQPSSLSDEIKNYINGHLQGLFLQKAPSLGSGTTFGKPSGSLVGVENANDLLNTVDSADTDLEQAVRKHDAFYVASSNPNVEAIADKELANDLKTIVEKNNLSRFSAESLTSLLFNILSDLKTNNANELDPGVHTVIGLEKPIIIPSSGTLRSALTAFPGVLSTHYFVDKTGRAINVDRDLRDLGYPVGQQFQAVPRLLGGMNTQVLDPKIDSHTLEGRKIEDFKPSIDPLDVPEMEATSVDVVDLARLVVDMFVGNMGIGDKGQDSYDQELFASTRFTSFMSGVSELTNTVQARTGYPMPSSFFNVKSVMGVAAPHVATTNNYNEILWNSSGPFGGSSVHFAPNQSLLGNLYIDPNADVMGALRSATRTSFGNGFTGGTIIKLMSQNIQEFNSGGVSYEDFYIRGLFSAMNASRPGLSNPITPSSINFSMKGTVNLTQESGAVFVDDTDVTSFAAASDCWPLKEAPSSCKFTTPLSALGWEKHAGSIVMVPSSGFADEEYFQDILTLLDTGGWGIMMAPNTGDLSYQEWTSTDLWEQILFETHWPHCTRNATYTSSHRTGVASALISDTLTWANSTRVVGRDNIIFVVPSDVSVSSIRQATSAAATVSKFVRRDTMQHVINTPWGYITSTAAGVITDNPIVSGGNVAYWSGFTCSNQEISATLGFHNVYEMSALINGMYEGARMNSYDGIIDNLFKHARMVKCVDQLYSAYIKVVLMCSGIAMSDGLSFAGNILGRPDYVVGKERGPAGIDGNASYAHSCFNTNNLGSSTLNANGMPATAADLSNLRGTCFTTDRSKSQWLRLLVCANIYARVNGVRIAINPIPTFVYSRLFSELIVPMVYAVIENARVLYWGRLAFQPTGVVVNKWIGIYRLMMEVLPDMIKGLFKDHFGHIPGKYRMIGPRTDKISSPFDDIVFNNGFMFNETKVFNLTAHEAVARSHLTNIWFEQWLPNWKPLIFLAVFRSVDFRLGWNYIMNDKLLLISEANNAGERQWLMPLEETTFDRLDLKSDLRLFELVNLIKYMSATQGQVSQLGLHYGSKFLNGGPFEALCGKYMTGIIAAARPYGSNDDVEWIVLVPPVINVSPRSITVNYDTGVAGHTVINNNAQAYTGSFGIRNNAYPTVAWYQPLSVPAPLYKDNINLGIVDSDEPVIRFLSSMKRKNKTLNLEDVSQNGPGDDVLKE